MKSPTETDSLAQKLCLHAKDQGALIVRALLQSEKMDDALKAILSQSDFLAAISALKPKLIYLTEKPFDFEERLRSALIEEFEIDDPESVDLDPIVEKKECRSLQKKWATRKNEIYEYVAFFQGDGVLHIATATAEWDTDFVSDFSGIAESLREQVQTEGDADNLREASAIRDMAKALIEHPKYKAPKATKDRKQFLAEELFPDLDEETLSDVLLLAENLDWFAAQ